jgi:hypothetical protein
MTPAPFADPTAPFDADAAKKAIGDSMFNLVKLMMPLPGASPDPSLADSFMTSVTGALAAGSQAISEVKRIRDDVAQMRDSHRPRPHADPTAAGALCEACSLAGSLTAWPCSVWTAAERILTHRQP